MGEMDSTRSVIGIVGPKTIDLGNWDILQYLAGLKLSVPTLDDLVPDA